MRLIDADKLKVTFANAQIYGLPMGEFYRAIPKIIDNAPTVEQLVGNSDRLPMPQGEWIRKVDKAGFISHICSKCGAEIEVEDCSDDKFCFNCGAKMKEAENDRDCEHCAHYVKAGLDWFCCESWECEFKPKGDEKND